MRRLFSGARAVLAGVAALIMVPALVATPVSAAEATFPVVQDCSPFGSFYRSWDRLPHRLHGDGTRWVPQGLTYDAGHHWLITSYYDGRDGVASTDKWRSMLVLTTLNGRYLKRLMINTADVDRGGHAGGLGVGNASLYISSTEHGPRVTRIPLRVLADAADGSTLPDSTSVDVAAASYATVADDDLYVGDFENDRMYRYQTDAAGDPISEPTIFSTPTLVQGVAVTDDQFIFSRSYGRTRLSYLTTVDRSSATSTDRVMPNMLEGISWAPNRPHNGRDLYVLFESGSAAYGPDDDGGSTTCMTHQLWHRSAADLDRPSHRA